MAAPEVERIKILKWFSKHYEAQEGMHIALPTSAFGKAGCRQLLSTLVRGKDCQSHHILPTLPNLALTIFIPEEKNEAQKGKSEKKKKKE